jgi:metal-responsive CopG/Arc/MetJ family transcriptional regulator
MAWTKKIVTVTLDKGLVKELDKAFKNPNKWGAKNRSALVESILKKELNPKRG